VSTVWDQVEVVCFSTCEYEISGLSTNSGPVGGRSGGEVMT